MRKYHPAGALPRLPVYGPEGTAERMARAYDLPDEPGMTSEFDFATYPESSFDVGPFDVDGDRRSTTRSPAYAHAGHRTAAARWSTPATPARARRWIEIAKGCDLLLAEASFVEARGQPAEPAPHRPRGGRRRRRAGRRPARADPRPAVARAGGRLAEATPSSTGPVELATRRAAYDI